MDGAIKFLSVCSGIEAASVAWNPLGWRAAAVAEIDPFGCHLLHHRHQAGRPMFMPDPGATAKLKEQRARKAAIKTIAPLPPDGAIPNFGDLEQFRKWPDATIDLLVGGTPCQSFSVAGLRKGLDDPRGNLALVYLAIAERYRPRWIVWENVPGVLSSNGGRDIGAFLGALGQLGYGWAYRVLDAQYVRTRNFSGAVPQRRRRVFVIGYLGSWQRAAAVLFDAQSLRGDSPPRREAGQGIASTLTSSLGGCSQKDRIEGRVIPEVSNALAARDAKQPRAEDNVGIIPVQVAHSIRGEGFDASEDGTGRGTPLIAFSAKDHGADAGDTVPTLRAMGHSNSHANAGGQVAVAHPIVMMERGRDGSRSLETRADGTANAILTPNGGRGGLGVGAIPFDTTQITSPGNFSRPRAGEPCHPLAAAAHPPAIADEWAVRRLTPRECERLQGFEDDYTLIPFRGGRMAVDGVRYKALGNSMAVNAMEWIGQRIAMVEAIS